MKEKILFCALVTFCIKPAAQTFTTQSRPGGIYPGKLTAGDRQSAIKIILEK